SWRALSRVSAASAWACESSSGRPNCTSASRRCLASSRSSRARETAWAARSSSCLVMKPSASSGLRSSWLEMAFSRARSALATGAPRLRLVQLALAVADVGQLQPAALDLLARRGQLLLVLDALQLVVLPRLLHVRLGQRELRLALADVLLEGRGVEEQEQVAL